MSKSSSTNYPKGFLQRTLSHFRCYVKDIARAAHRARIVQPHRFRQNETQSSLGGYSSEVPPLPIPNREVKLTNADGTAYLGGRVGSRLFKPRQKCRGFFLCHDISVGLEEIVPLPFIQVFHFGISALNCSVKQRTVVQAEGRADIIPYIIYAMPRRGQSKPRTDCLRQSSAS